MDADRQACLAAGMRDHVAKPVDLEQLVATLRRHAGRAEAAVPAAAPAAPPRLLDSAAALQRLGGRQALYERLVASFAKDAPAEIDSLRRSRREASVPDVARALHTLRGLAGAVGGNALAALAGAQEQSVRSQNDVAGADPEALRALLQETLAALQAASPSPPAGGPADALDVPLALQQLRQLLAERNMRSVALCEQLAGHAQALGAEFPALNAAVGRLDFASALKACDALLAAQPRG
jgi:HPt (histidine-containing phosphotransfer) domain-containing protein